MDFSPAAPTRSKDPCDPVLFGEFSRFVFDDSPDIKNAHFLFKSFTFYAAEDRQRPTELPSVTW